MVVAPLAGRLWLFLSAAGVDDDGWVYRIGYNVDYSSDGVRPALHLNLQS